MDADKEIWYRTGTAARQLATSPHKIRELAKAGLIESQMRRNGYIYIPARELERLASEGLPPMPANADLPEGTEDGSEQPDAPTRPRSRATQELYAEPSRQLVKKNEAVIGARLSVEQKRYKQEERDLDEAAAQRRAQARQAQMQQRWRDELIERVMLKVPPELFAATSDSVREFLDRVPPCSNVTAKVDEIIETARRPVERRRSQDRAAEQALGRLDPSVRENALRKMEARSAVENAVAHLPDHSGYPEMCAVAEAAVVQINAAVSHRNKIQSESAIGLFDLGWGATSAEVEEAQALARAALQALAVGVPNRQFRKVRDDAIAPVVERINRRRGEASRRSAIDQAVSNVSVRMIFSGGTSEVVADAKAKVRAALERLPASASAYEMSKAEDAVLEPIAAAARRAREVLSAQVDKRLGVLQISFSSSMDRWNLRDQVTKRIRPAIFKELSEDPAMSDRKLERRIDQLVDECYEDFLTDE